MREFEQELIDFLNEKLKDENMVKLLEDDFTGFMHLLANIIPTMVFNTLTGEQKNMLDFNHIANKLCFQYMEKEN